MKAKTAAGSLSLSNLANFQSGDGAAAASLLVLSRLPAPAASASLLIKYSIYTFNTRTSPRRSHSIPGYCSCWDKSSGPNNVMSVDSRGEMYTAKWL